MRIEERLLDCFQVRKSKQQKTEFIGYVTRLCGEKGLSVKVEQKGSTRNIVIGDPDRAKVIVGAHYDTCALMPIPNFIMPMKPAIYFGYSLLIGLTMLAVAIAAALGVSFWVAEWLYTPVYLTVLIAAAALLMAGPANPHTANDNTSGTALVLRLATELPAELRDKVCFVLFDQEELGLLGSGKFASMHKKAAKQTFMLNFDCVGDGDYLLPVPKKGAQNAAEFEAFSNIAESVCKTYGKTLLRGKAGHMIYPSDQKHFAKGVGIVFLRKGKPGYFMSRIHTKRDTVLQTENLDALEAATLAFLEQI